MYRLQNLPKVHFDNNHSTYLQPWERLRDRLTTSPPILSHRHLTN